MMLTMVMLALFPVIVLIAFGYGLRRFSFLEAGFWPQAERLSYYVLLPALFIHGLSTADISRLPVKDIALVLMGTTMTVALLVMLYRPFFKGDGAQFTSVFQGAIRFNNYIGVTFAAALYNAEGIAMAAVCNAAMVPLINLLCVLVFARFGSARLNFKGIVKQIVTNPLLVSCCVGIALQASGLHLPELIAPAVRVLGSASLPIGLLCVGAALQFNSAREWFVPVMLSSVAKFMLMPAVAFVFVVWLGLDERTSVIILVFMVLPTASSSYIMARQLGGDAPLMAGITAVQTVLASVAIPLIFMAYAALQP